MSLRRVSISTTVIIGLLAAVVAGRNGPSATTAQFGIVPFASRPFVSHGSPIGTTWYCPGVPAGDGTVGGDIVLANPTSAPKRAQVTLLGSNQAAPVKQDITVPPRSNYSLSVGNLVTATFVAAIVELEGGDGVVEQRALFPAGNAVSSCITETSSTWYFADGFTLDGSTDQIILTNPTANDASVSLAFITKSGKREPAAFQGDSVAARSVKVISVADNGLKDESIIGVQVIAARGAQLIVGRAQHYFGGNRLGYSLTLGAPAPSAQVWFADGETGAGITEQYVMFNPTDQDATVDIAVLGVGITSAFNPPDPVPVPAGEVVVFDVAAIVGLPAGRHSMVFATLAAASVVIERVLTRPAGDSVSTTVVMGMTAEFAVPRWYVPVSAESALPGALVVYNVDGVDATVTVKAVGPGGELAIPSLTDIPIGAGGIATIDLVDASAFGLTLVVESTQRLYVERLLSRGGDLAGRSGSWAVPDCGPCNLLSRPSS